MSGPGRLVLDTALLHQAVEHYAAAAPDHPAVIEGDRTVSYGELRSAMNRVAHVLRGRGLERNGRVGILLDNGIDACRAILGTLAADGCYVPLNPAFPAPKLAGIVSDADMGALITTTEHLPLLESIMAKTGPLSRATLLVLDDDQDLGSADDATPACRNVEEDLAYVLYTSGTTGKPKGVMVTHRNVKSFTAWQVDYFGITPADRVANHPRISFDMSVFDLFGAFFGGATLCPVVKPGDRAFPGPFIRDHRISLWYSVPSALGMLIKTKQLTPGAFADHMRYAVFAGEPLPPAYAAAWRETHPEVPIVNLYGPTEATVSVTFHNVGVDTPFDMTKPIPIGRPTRDTEVLILKPDSDERADVGEPGRLMLCGTQVAAGYWRQPELTAQAFRTNPFKQDSGARMYDTGDWAYVDAGGTVHFLGRKDGQVKIRGYRVELAEIEIALQNHADVSEAAVLYIPGDPDVLLAAVALQRGVPDEPSAAEIDLIDHCRALLPDHMVPDEVHFHDVLPKNVNGKTDRRALQRQYTETPPGAK